jgi:hypothetical protein
MLASVRDQYFRVTRRARIRCPTCRVDRQQITSALHTQRAFRLRRAAANGRRWPNLSPSGDQGEVPVGAARATTPAVQGPATRSSSSAPTWRRACAYARARRSSTWVLIRPSNNSCSTRAGEMANNADTAGRPVIRTGVGTNPVCADICAASCPHPTPYHFSDRGLALSPARLETNPGQFVLIVMKVQEP